MDLKTDSELLKGYRRLVDISCDLASTLELNPLLDRIVSAAADITGAEAASILLYDETSRQLFFQVATNLNSQTMRGLSVPLEGSIAGWMVTNRKSVRVSDVSADQRYYKKIEENTATPTHSLMGLPLIAKEKVVGVLEVINKISGDFSSADEDLLTVLGAQAAVAIENARLFQQSDLVSEFVHELRNPLSAMSTATYLLLRPEISREQREQITNSLNKEALRLSALASSFLDLARLESGRVQFNYESMDTNLVIQDCLNAVHAKAEEKQIQVRYKMPDGRVPNIECDEDKIKQVILNLLSNAIKYNEPGGSVTLSAEFTADLFILTVADTGFGIPNDAFPHLFEKFYRVKQTEETAVGTGLGLSIVKQIVQGLNGEIEVSSKVGRGTTFIIRLPRLRKQQPDFRV